MSTGSWRKLNWFCIISKHFKVCHRTNPEILIIQLTSWFLGHYPYKSIYCTFKRYWTTLFGTTAAVRENMVRRTRKRRLETWKANRPIATNCEEKQESALFHKNETEGGCFSSEKKAGNSFLAGFASFCSLAEPAIYIVSDHQWPNSTASFTWSEFPFHAPERRGRTIGDLDPWKQLFVFKGQRSTKPF